MQFDPHHKIASGGVDSEFPGVLGDFETPNVGIERHQHGVTVAFKRGTQGSLRKILYDRDLISRQLEIARSMWDEYSQLSLEICDEFIGSYMCCGPLASNHIRLKEGKVPFVYSALNAPIKTAVWLSKEWRYSMVRPSLMLELIINVCNTVR